MFSEDTRGEDGRGSPRRETPGLTAWPWLCPETGGTACEILDDEGQADRRIEAWYDEVHRYSTMRSCREHRPQGSVDLILLNRSDWDAGIGAESALRACVELLRPGGHAIFMLPNRRFRTPRLTALGFSRIRVYLCSDEPGYVRSMIPRERAALLAAERVAFRGGFRGRMRLGAAAVGLGSQLHSAALVLAER